MNWSVVHMRLRRMSRFGMAALMVLAGGAATGRGEELRPGVWAGPDLSALPLPVSGYQVYLLGEQHGVKETEGLLAQYLARLYAGAGLRDVAFEEDAVYEREAEDFVNGKSSGLPETLCLRAGFLQVIRHFNEGRTGTGLVRVHLVDIDTPATAIRQHLLSIKERVAAAAALRVPDAMGIRKHGLKVVDGLEKLPGAAPVSGELRTVRYSIIAYQQGLEVGTGAPKGSPYLDAREEAISRNIQDLLHEQDCPAVLALYGSDHVSKAQRKDGGPGRDRPFEPMALRLQQSGVKVFSLVTYPLAGHTSWRGRRGELPYAASDGSLADGETLDRVLAAAPGATLLYVDPRQQRVRLPSQDATAYGVDAFLLLASATAMENRCVPE